MTKTIAYTKADRTYPGYLNISTGDDGRVTISVRADGSTRCGAHVCGFAADKGKHGRCTPGDDNCNNYCNMAPQKGPMQPRPKPCEIVECGASASLTLTAEEWASVKDQIS